MALFPPPSYQPMASLPEETKTKAEGTIKPGIHMTLPIYFNIHVPQEVSHVKHRTHTHTSVYEADKVIPLPSYDQSQKYEQDGVLEMEEDEEPEPTQSLSVMSKPPGTCLDFTMFFLCELP